VNYFPIMLCIHRLHIRHSAASQQHTYGHDFCRSRYLSLFGWCSTVDVTDLLVIIDPFFIFHWFCLVFLHTWFQSHSLPVVYLTLCFPSCLCQRLFHVSVSCRLYLVRDGSSYPICFVCILWFWSYVLFY
jgi:hypothetical protein